MTDRLTHDLALARAERNAYVDTCEELHRTIAGLHVEIDAHLGHCEAADQRVRSLIAALDHEREVTRGLTMKLDAAARTAVDATDELSAIRSLVAPGNDQGTVVDAVRAFKAAESRTSEQLDAAIARAEKAERERAVGSRPTWKCNKCGALAALTAALCDRCIKQEHRDRWMLLPAPTQDEIDDARAWLDAMQDEIAPVVLGYFVEDANGEDQGEDYCLEHAREVAATLDGAHIGSTAYDETDAERWCDRNGCGKQLDTGVFTSHGEASVLGLTEDDPMRAGTSLYGLRRVGWNMTPNNPRAALWLLHVDDHRSDMADNLAAAYRPEVP